MKNNKIVFINTIPEMDNGFEPKPASKCLPNWYKDIPSYVNNKKHIDIENSNIPMTIKKCMPVFDAMTAGYYLFTHCDIFVTQKDNIPYYSWAITPAVEFHNTIQAPNHPSVKPTDYPKFVNKWGIKTPPGYSVLFINPMHNPSNIFTILEGVVDTDKYTNTVNFPFVLNNNNWEGMIPAGTPIAQIIPFKRDKWKMNLGNEKDIKEQKLVLLKLKTYFTDAYKILFRSEKEYR